MKTFHRNCQGLSEALWSSFLFQTNSHIIFGHSYLTPEEDEIHILPQNINQTHTLSHYMHTIIDIVNRILCSHVSFIETKKGNSRLWFYTQNLKQTKLLM